MPRVFDNWGCSASGSTSPTEEPTPALIESRSFNIIDSDTSFPTSAFIRGLIQINASLQNGTVVATVPDDAQDGDIIDVGVHFGIDGNVLRLVSGDATAVNWKDNLGVIDNSAEIKEQGHVVFYKNGNYWEAIRGYCSCMPVPDVFTVSGSLDESDPYSLGITINDTNGGSGTGATYEVTLDFLHPDQNNRQIIMTGALTDAPSVAGFSGTLGQLVANNITADVFSEVQVTVVATDAASTTTQATTVMSTSADYALSKIMFDHDGTGGPNGTLDPVINKLHFSRHLGAYDFGNGQTGTGLSPVVTPTGPATDAYVETPVWTLHKLFMLDDGVTKLDLQTATLMDTLNTNGNATPDLYLEDNELLRVLSAQSSQVVNVTLPMSGILAQAFLNNNSITAIDLSGQAALSDLRIGGNPLTGLDVTANPLTYLACNYCPNIDYVDFTGQSDLNTIYVDVCSITQVNLALMLAQLDTAHSVGTGKYIKVSGQSTGAVINTGTPEAASADSLVAKGFNVVSDGTWTA